MNQSSNVYIYDFILTELLCGCVGNRVLCYLLFTTAFRWTDKCNSGFMFSVGTPPPTILQFSSDSNYITELYGCQI